MIYLPDHNLIYLHIPKTGGTFARKALVELNTPYEAQRPSHAEAKEAADWKPGVPMFAFLRHPTQWYRSYWMDRMNTGWGGDLIIAHKCDSNDFNKFVLNVVERCPGFLGDLYQLYTDGYSTTFYKYEGLFSVFENLLGPKLSEVEPANVGLMLYRNQTIYDVDVANKLMESESKALQMYDEAELGLV